MPRHSNMVLAILCVTFSVACADKKDDAAPASTAPSADMAPVDTAPKPVPKKAPLVRIPRTDDRRRSDAVLVEIDMHPKWERSAQKRIAHWEPAGGDGTSWFELSVWCLGPCDPAVIDENIAKRTAPEWYADPNTEVTNIEVMDGGVIQTLRLLKRKQFRVIAYYHRPEDRFAVRLTGVAPLVEELAYRDLFLTAARSLRIAVTSIEADRKNALVIADKPFVIESIPKDIALQHKQIDDVFMVTRNIVLADVPVSTEGSINTDRISGGRRLHKFLLAADHEFTNPGGIKGVSVKCAEGEWVEDWGDFQFSCSLIAPFSHGELTFAPFHIVRIYQGIVTVAYLNEDATIEGKECKAGMQVTRGSDGKLEECKFDKS